MSNTSAPEDEAPTTQTNTETTLMKVKNMKKLPAHVLVRVFSFLSPLDVSSLAPVSSWFYNAADNANLWRIWFTRRWGNQERSIRVDRLLANEDHDGIEQLEEDFYTSNADLPWRNTYISRHQLREHLGSLYGMRGAEVCTPDEKVDTDRLILEHKTKQAQSISLNDAEGQEELGLAASFHSRDNAWREAVGLERKSRQPDVVAIKTSVPVTAMKFDRNKIAYSCGGGNVRVVSFKDGRKLGTFKAKGKQNTNNVTCLDFSEKLLVTGCVNATLKLYRWDSFSASKIGFAKKHKHEQPISCVKLRGNNVWTSSLDGSSKLWDVESGQCLGSFGIDTKQNPRSLLAFDSFSENEWVTGSNAVRGKPAFVGLWDKRVDGGLVFSQTANCGGVRCVMVNRESPRVVAAGGMDGVVRVYDTRYFSKRKPAVIVSAHYEKLPGRVCNPVRSVSFVQDKLFVCRPNAFSVFQTQTLKGLCSTHLYIADPDVNDSSGHATTAFLPCGPSRLPVAYELTHMNATNFVEHVRPDRFVNMSLNRKSSSNSPPLNPLTAGEQEIPQYRLVRYDSESKVLAVGTDSHIVVWGGKLARTQQEGYRAHIEHIDDNPSPYKRGPRWKPETSQKYVDVNNFEIVSEETIYPDGKHRMVKQKKKKAKKHKMNQKNANRTKTRIRGRF